MKKINAFILLLCMTVSVNAATFNQHRFYKAFLKSDLTEWHDFIADHSHVSDDSLLLVLDLEYNYLAWASTQKLADNMLRLGVFNRHIKEYEQLPDANPSDLLAFQSASHVYSLSILDKKAVSHSLQAMSCANQACKKNPTARALMHQGFMYFYRPKYAGGNKEKALFYLRQAEKMYKKQSGSDKNWNLRNTQMHIAQCLIKLDRKSDAERYIKRVLEEEPAMKALMTLN